MLDRVVRYVQSGEGQVAYAAVGSGPLELLYLDDWGWHLEAMFDDADTVAYAERFGSFARLIFVNRRGVGMSDPAPPEQMTIDSGLEDTIAVLDAEGIGRAAVMGAGGGVAVASVLAAARPDRVKALVLIDDTSGLAWGEDRDNADSLFAWAIDEIEGQWGKGFMATIGAPSRLNDPGFMAWVGRMERLTCTPRLAAAMARAIYETDLSDVLPLVAVPTLVIHMTGYLLRDSHLRDLIPGARYVEVPGEPIWTGTDNGRVADEVEEFLTGVRPSRESERVLATLVFTDIVASTAHAARLGDAAWRGTLDRHDELARQLVAKSGGRIVKLTGDGMLAIFDGPTRGVSFALAMRAAVSSLGLSIRAGVHTGEVELRGDDIGGLGVHIAARVCALAGPDEVFTSRTAKDLTAGSGINFTDRGAHVLKGVPDEWQILSVTSE